MTNHSRAILASVVLAVGADITAEARAEDLYQPLASDLHADTSDSVGTELRGIQFGRVFTGGFSRSLQGSDTDTTSAGLFFRRDLEHERELVLGTSFVNSNDIRQRELQAKYSLSNGIDVAAGYFKTGITGQSDVYFARFNYKISIASSNLFIGPFVQRNPDHHYDPGISAVFTNTQLLLASGFDGEQLRASVNWSAKYRESSIRPAVEILYADDSVGSIDGTKLTLLAGTLSYSGGFLDQRYAFGRASGPTNVTYNSPVSFTSVNWNRAHDVWEYGNVANIRIFRTENGSDKITDYSSIVYPRQLIDRSSGPASNIFVGFRYVERNADKESEAPMIGYHGNLFEKLTTSLSYYYDLHTEKSELVLGFVYAH